MLDYKPNRKAPKQKTKRSRKSGRKPARKAPLQSALGTGTVSQPNNQRQAEEKPTPWDAVIQAAPGYAAKTIFAAIVFWLGLGLVREGAALWNAPLHTVDVTGNEKLTARELVAAAGLSAGLAVGDIDPFSAATRLMALPRVRAADVRRIFPGRISIRVEERRPRALIDGGGADRALIDSEGVVLMVAPRNAFVDQPFPVILRRGITPRPGVRIRDEKLLKALALIDGVEAREFSKGDTLLVAVDDPFSLRLALLHSRRELILPPKGALRALDRYLDLAPSLGEISEKPGTIDLRLLESGSGERIIFQ